VIDIRSADVELSIEQALTGRQKAHLHQTMSVEDKISLCREEVKSALMHHSRLMQHTPRLKEFRWKSLGWKLSMAQEGLLDRARLVDGMLVSEDKLSQYSESSIKPSPGSQRGNSKAFDDHIELKKKLMNLKISKPTPSSAFADDALGKPSNNVDRISNLANSSSNGQCDFVPSLPSKQAVEDSVNIDNQNSIEDGKLAELMNIV
jgi:hypothetical protein